MGIGRTMIEVFGSLYTQVDVVVHNPGLLCFLIWSVFSEKEVWLR